MARSVEFSEAVLALAELGLLYHIRGGEVAVLAANSVHPTGVEVLRLRQDMQGFSEGEDFDTIEVGTQIPQAWRGLPAPILRYLLALDSLGLRLVARKDILEFAEVYYIATDGFSGDDLLGGQEGGVPRLVLVFDVNGQPKKWGVYGPRS